MSIASSWWIHQTLNPKMVLRTFIGVTVLVNLTACTFNLDDPIGAKSRRAEERRAELLGGFGVEQQDHFYDVEAIWLS